MFKKMIKLYLFVVSLFIAINAQGSIDRTGDFDIGKVRDAVIQGTDTQGVVNQGEKITLKSDAESYVVVTLRIIGYLALLIAIITGVAWVMKKSGLAGSSKFGGGGAMDVLEVLPFGQNRNAVLIRVMDTVYLLGQTANTIVLLEKIEGQRAIDLIASSKETSIVQFKDAFNNFLGKMKKS